MFGKRFLENTHLLSAFLVLAETFLSLLLRFDKPLQQRIAPLVKSNTVLCVRTYLPHYEFFVRFAENGILLDSKLEEVPKEHILVSASMVTMVKLLMTGDESLVKKMQFKGDTKDINTLKECVHSMGIRNVMLDVANNLKKIDPDQVEKDQEIISEISAQISKKDTTIETLNETLLSTQKSNNKLQKQIRMLLMLLVCMVAGFIAVVFYTMN